jgi:hypothetical protein
VQKTNTYQDAHFALEAREAIIRHHDEKPLGGTEHWRQTFCSASNDEVAQQNRHATKLITQCAVDADASRLGAGVPGWLVKFGKSRTGVILIATTLPLSNFSWLGLKSPTRAIMYFSG